MEKPAAPDSHPGFNVTVASDLQLMELLKQKKKKKESQRRLLTQRDLDVFAAAATGRTNALIHGVDAGVVACHAAVSLCSGSAVRLFLSGTGRLLNER